MDSERKLYYCNQNSREWNSNFKAANSKIDRNRKSIGKALSLSSDDGCSKMVRLLQIVWKPGTQFK